MVFMEEWGNDGASAAPDPAAGDDPLHPLLRILLDAEKNKLPLLLGRNVQLAVVLLLARPPLAANPDAKHPGKAREESQGESELSLGIFPAFLGQKPSYFRKPQRRRRRSSDIFVQVISPSVGPGRSPPWSGVWGQSAPNIDQICKWITRHFLWITPA